MDCLFCKIVAGEIKANIVLENDKLLAFRDIQPQAPVHILIVPKHHVSTINDLATDDSQWVGEMVVMAKAIAEKEGIASDGYRLLFNVNHAGGQAVYHIHLHIIGGRQMQWPPG